MHTQLSTQYFFTAILYTWNIFASHTHTFGIFELYLHHLFTSVDLSPIIKKHTTYLQIHTIHACIEYKQ